MVMIVAALVLAPLFEEQNLVLDPQRLALTPTIDGVMQPDEWDMLLQQGPLDGYFQWEPSKLHFAAKMPTNQDLLISLDLRTDGWQKGKDNLEIRIDPRTQKATVKRLKPTQEGPKWDDEPLFEKTCALGVKTEAGSSTVEFTLTDPTHEILPVEESKIGLRYDLVDASEKQIDPFLPRTLSPIKLGYQRAAGLPETLKWKIERWDRTTNPGKNFSMRFLFNGDNSLNLNRIELAHEGALRDKMNVLAVNFPPFDNKGRAIQDYTTPIPDDKEVGQGYRLIRATVSSKDGGTGVIQTSYRVAELADFDLVPVDLKPSEKDRTERLSYYVISNSKYRLTGVVKIFPPAGFKVSEGGQKTVVLYNGFSRVRRVFDLDIPADAKGIYPVTFQMLIGSEVVKRTEWLELN